jgi:DNA repair photolyase
MNPVVPGITSKPALLERTVKAISDHGARFIGCNVMFLEGGTRDHFMRWLGEQHPELVEGYAKLYARKYAPTPYRKEVSATIAALKKKYGATEQRYPDAKAEATPRSRSDQPMLRDADLPLQP